MKRKTIGFKSGALVVDYYLKPIANQNDVDKAAPKEMFICRRCVDKIWLYTELGRIALPTEDLRTLRDGLDDLFKDEAEEAENLRSF